MQWNAQRSESRGHDERGSVAHGSTEMTAMASARNRRFGGGVGVGVSQIA